MNKSKTSSEPLKELPILPRGEGVFRYINNGNDIRYEKYIVLEPFNIRKRLSVTGKTPQQCRAKMKERETKVLEKARQEYKHSSDNPTVTLFDALIEWCNNNSHNMKATSIDRRQRTVENQIQDSRIGRQQVQEISSEDIEEYFHWLQFEATTNKGEKGYSFSVVRKAYDILKSFLVIIIQRIWTTIQ